MAPAVPEKASGPSGSPHDHHCDGIIDDGLLIEGTKILAGTSAKTEQNKVQAVKRAIFMEKDHCREVRTALAGSDIQTLLVIGTSDKMVGTICKRLQIPAPSETVYIQDVSTTREMKKARETRIKEGKHVVPVPTIELKPHLSGVLVDLPHRLFSGTGSIRPCRKNPLSGRLSAITGRSPYPIMWSATLCGSW